MWPHRITVGLGRYAVVVATDGAQAASRLEPWRIDEVDGCIDYHLDLSPEAEEGNGGLRPLPGLWHGNAPLLRSTDTSRLTDTLLRILAGHAQVPGPAQVRVAFLPLIRDSVALLVPLTRMVALADRRLQAHGIHAVYTTTSLIDVRTAEVLIDPPLGSGEEPVAVPLGGWWRPMQEGEAELTCGQAVAEVMQAVVGVTADNANATLRDIASLVQRVPLISVPTGPENDLGDLLTALDTAAGGQPQADR